MKGMNVKLFDDMYSTTADGMSRQNEALFGGLQTMLATANMMTPQIRAAMSDITATSSGAVHYQPAAGHTSGFDDGGVVPGPKGKPQLALVHGGETIIPTHKPGIDFPDYDSIAGSMKSGGSMLYTTFNGRNQTIIVELDGSIIAKAIADPFMDKVRIHSRSAI
jgi:hypothetical protein